MKRVFEGRCIAGKWLQKQNSVSIFGIYLCDSEAKQTLKLSCRWYLSDIKTVFVQALYISININQPEGAYYLAEPANSNVTRLNSPVPNFHSYRLGLTQHWSKIV